MDANGWMGRALAAAGFYHLGCGASALLFPALTAGWIGLGSTPHPELLQAIGALGVAFSAACFIASLNPLSHWLAALLGLLGSAFAAAGFAIVAAKASPISGPGLAVAAASAGWAALFAAVLRQAAAAFVSEAGQEIPPPRERLMLKFMAQNGLTFYELSQRQPVLTVFLRHAGCTFCREALGDIRRLRPRIEAQGAGLVFVHMSPEPEAQQFFAEYGLADVPRISDPRAELYRVFDLPRGTFKKMLAPRVWLRGLRAGLLEGAGAGKIQGDPFRMPGVFLVHRGRVIRSFRHQWPSDRPDYVALAKCEGCGGAPADSPQLAAPAL